MRKIGLVLAALGMLTASAVIAGKQQVSSSSYVAAGKSGHLYGRSDGMYQEANSMAPVIVENGEPASWPGVGYRETFAYGDGKGLTSLDASGLGTTCAGNTTTVPCLHTFGSGVKLVELPVVTNTLPADMDASSLDIGGDQVADDGMEIVGGVMGASGRPFIVGDDAPFYFCATIGLTDVSGTDDLHMGFRASDEVFNAVFDNYTDLASIGAISGDIYIETILNNAATTSTDTTDNWADAAVKKLCIYVGATGAVTYTIDGAAPTTTATYTFADGLPVIPFIHYIHDTDICDEIDLTLWEVGYQQ